MTYRVTIISNSPSDISKLRSKSAEDVFSSLAVPLMTLVGLKSGHMAKQGRSTAFFISNNY
ncbi:hypothetical protein CTI12_AA381850 [Artemisia annua]|uniref:Uncharacterized protein n=1 Tax=Artemisia annua TaxID=35608 RepID=A0A2U1MGS9_ARTAN|nr:hypothetical protein CTI12_AA381850 [Artemisia annua]